jgi:WhiB family transcriptional regulator, redox-sensing transcriptional regulator
MGEPRYPMRPETGDWLERAACSGRPGTPLEHLSPRERVVLFYPPQRSGPGATVKAKAVCEVCPVRSECLMDALANGERHGVRGGKSPKERRSLAKLHPPKLERKPAGCGTPAGYKEHYRRGERACFMCLHAHAERERAS